jgi:acyl-CoA reductase-like NAD-dependent aldehyde dehydrogenase
MFYIVPSFLTGNISLLKPSSQTSAIGLELEQIFSEQAFEQSVLSLVLRTKELPEFLKHVNVNSISYQGSRESGKSVYE